jgi:hypothetical protein
MEEDWFKRFSALHEKLNIAYQQVLEGARPADTHAHSAFEGVEAELRATCVRLGNN